jgi:DNA modification methylase
MMIDMLDQIITGDAKVLAERIPDASIDLIFTDPVYDRIEDYAWLAQTAARVLKPNRACLAWCSNVQQFDVQPVMREYLRFVLPLNYTKIAKTYAAHRYRAFLWSTPLLWFQKGDFVHEWLIDTVIDVMQGNSIVTALAPPSKTYKWHKNPEAYIAWLKAFTKPGDIVYDPFAGSGSLPVECKRMERHFIASEIHADIAAAARERVAQTQVVAPAFQSTQLDLFGAA